MFVLLPALLLAAQAEAPPPEVPQGRRQTFIAPSGEPFRVHGDVPYPVANWFSAADKNGDGKLDFTEFDADFLRFFDQLDTNHDGAIDSGEKAKYETDIAPETTGQSFGGERGGSSGTKTYDKDSDTWEETGDKPAYDPTVLGAARYDLLGIPEPVAAMDAQLRGRITRRDAEDAARLRFNQLDSLHRGYLTLDALPATFAQRRGGGGSGGGGGGDHGHRHHRRG